MRILIAEDQPELRRMLVKNLTAAGYTASRVLDTRMPKCMSSPWRAQWMRPLKQKRSLKLPKVSY